jgi:tRNA(fMet)-specific endonuclease VapC
MRMSGNLIDTNIVIKLLNGDATVSELFDTLQNICLPAITVGELMYGANKSSRRESNTKLFSDFISEYQVLGVNAKVAEAYGGIKHGLVQKGVNIPENDIWIAAIAMSSDMRLITADGHFASISGLQSEIIKL